MMNKNKSNNIKLSYYYHILVTEKIHTYRLGTQSHSSRNLRRRSDMYEVEAGTWNTQSDPITADTNCQTVLTYLTNFMAQCLKYPSKRGWHISHPTLLQHTSDYQNIDKYQLLHCSYKVLKHHKEKLLGTFVVILNVVIMQFT